MPRFRARGLAGIETKHATWPDRGEKGKNKKKSHTCIKRFAVVPVLPVEREGVKIPHEDQTRRRLSGLPVLSLGGSRRALLAGENRRRRLRGLEKPCRLPPISKARREIEDDPPFGRSFVCCASSATWWQHFILFYGRSRANG